MLRNLGDKIKTSAIVAPAALSATTLTAAQDMQGLKNFAFLLQAGSFAFDGTNYLTCTIQECDTSDGTYVDTTDVLVLNDQASQENEVHVLEYTGNKRYVKLNIVESGTVAAPLAVSGLSTAPELMPAQ